MDWSPHHERKANLPRSPPSVDVSAPIILHPGGGVSCCSDGSTPPPPPHPFVTLDYLLIRREAEEVEWRRLTFTSLWGRSCLGGGVCIQIPTGLKRVLENSDQRKRRNCFPAGISSGMMKGDHMTTQSDFSWWVSRKLEKTFSSAERWTPFPKRDGQSLCLPVNDANVAFWNRRSVQRQTRTQLGVSAVSGCLYRLLFVWVGSDLRTCWSVWIHNELFS